MTALRAGAAPAPIRADVEQLMRQLRETNEKLIVAAVHSQDASDKAHSEMARARAELDELMHRLKDANDQLVERVAETRRLAAEARLSQEAYRRLSRQLLSVQDDERRRLALQLHDSTGQRLAALAMNLDVVERGAQKLDASSRRALTESRSLADQCSREIRTFAYLLHPPLLDEKGLLSVIPWYVEGFSRRSGIHVGLDLCDVGRLPRPVETALFRIVQEGLTNVHRHASATEASIRLATTADAIVLEIQDQGVGLRDQVRGDDGTLEPMTLGVGIQGMRERIRQLGGAFEIEFTDGGTTVRVSVPPTADTR